MFPLNASFRDAMLLINPFEKDLEGFFPPLKALKNKVTQGSLTHRSWTVVLWLTIYLVTMSSGCTKCWFLVLCVSERAHWPVI